MRLRTFTAANMQAAMKMVREAMGEDAIIVASEPINGRKAVSVTAAIDYRDDDTPMPSQAEGERLRFELQEILRFHNMPEIYVAKMMKILTAQDLSDTVRRHGAGSRGDRKNLHRAALEKMAGKFFEFAPLPLEQTPLKLMLVGAPGVGKTLTIAKLAASLVIAKQPLTVITTDDQRAGGIEQLESFTTILGLELKVAASAKDLAKHMDVPKGTRILIDTAGCNPYDREGLKTIKDYGALPHVESVLVLPAGGDCMEAVDGVEMFAPLKPKRLLFTRADATRRFGNVLAAAAAHGLAFCQVSASGSAADALLPATPELLARLMLQYQLQNG